MYTFAQRSFIFVIQHIRDEAEFKWIAVLNSFVVDEQAEVKTI